MFFVLLALLGGLALATSAASGPTLDANLPPRVRAAVRAALSATDPGRTVPARLSAFAAALAANKYPLAARAVAARVSKG